MTPETFVTEIERILEPETFKGVCQLAKDGKMGWGIHSNDWGDKDGRG